MLLLKSRVTDCIFHLVSVWDSVFRHYLRMRFCIDHVWDQFLYGPCTKGIPGRHIPPPAQSRVSSTLTPLGGGMEPAQPLRAASPSAPLPFASWHILADRLLQMDQTELSSLFHGIIPCTRLNRALVCFPVLGGKFMSSENVFGEINVYFVLLSFVSFEFLY